MLDEIKKQIIEFIRKATEVEISTDELVIPPDDKFGNLSLACFGLAKILKQSPVEVAQKLVEAISHELSATRDKRQVISRANAVGPYLNFFLDQSFLNKKILEQDIEKTKLPKTKGKIMVEYSGPNPGKGFHIGHLRNTVLGIALINLLRRSGYKIIPVNYLNDTGTHIAKVIWIYQKYYAGKEPKANRGEWLGWLYAEAEEKLQANPEIKDEISLIHKKLEAKEKLIISIWKKINQWSLADFNKIYKQLGAKFKKIYWDRDYINQGKKIVDELLEKGIAMKSDGAVVVDLEKYNLPTLVVLKSDGTALYITKDIAMAKERFKEYNPDKMIYVVGNEQSLHFRQLFKILDLYGFNQAKNCYHLSYELVRLKEGKMSSRAGKVILYEDLFEQALAKSLAETEKRHLDWPKKKIALTAEKISLAALKFDMLKHDTNQIITFDFDEALSFEGDTGPYLLYTYARIQSIKRKLQTTKPQNKSKQNIDYSLLNSLEEKKLIKEISRFNDVLISAIENYKPSLVAVYLLNLAQELNTFYHKHKVIDGNNTELTWARLKLIDRVGQALQNGLNLLGIKELEQM
jgi:arginyl-tRNA synthetase